MPKMTAMEAAVKILESEGVKHIFGIPGAGILPFYRALKDLGTIKHMVTRHEEGAIHMADGYARAVGTVGVCAATSGPGASNFVTGLYTAQVDSIPILALTGQNVTAQLGREAFQAVDIAEIVKPVTKKAYCVKEPAMVPWVFREAFKIMREGRPGPVLIDLPLDVQKERSNTIPSRTARCPSSGRRPTRDRWPRPWTCSLRPKSPSCCLGGASSWPMRARSSWPWPKPSRSLWFPPTWERAGSPGTTPSWPVRWASSATPGPATRPSWSRTSFWPLGPGSTTGTPATSMSTRAIANSSTWMWIPGSSAKNIMPHLGICADAKLTLQALLDEIKARRTNQG